MISIVIKERSRRVLSAQEWDLVSSSPVFDDLLESGVVRHSLLPGGRVRLAASCFIGRAVLHPEVTLDIVEKIPGALAALLEYVSRRSFKVHKLPSFADDLSNLTVLLIEEFLKAAEQYLAKGREFEYSGRALAGPLVAGRLLIPQTVRLRARGLGHLIAYEKREQSFSTPLNRVILSGLRQIERIGRVISVPAHDLVRTRSASMLFTDCLHGDVLFGDQDTLLGLADEAELLAQRSGNAAHLDLIALARVLLEQRGFRIDQAQSDVLPRSWFVNLENMFERAVRRELNRQWAPGTVWNGKDDPKPIFPAHEAGPGANPDLVFDDASQGVQLIGDVKYKDWSGSIASSDLYQLLVHASSFSTTRAFTVQPDSDYGFVSLGEAATGCSVGLFALNIRNIAGGVTELLKEFEQVPCGATAQAEGQS